MSILTQYNGYLDLISKVVPHLYLIKSNAHIIIPVIVNLLFYTFFYKIQKYSLDLVLSFMSLFL